MSFVSVIRKIRDYALIIVLASLCALVYVLFIFPNSFAPSGINGIATMVQYVLGINVGYLSLIINIPLILIVFFYVDKQFAVRTLVYILVFSGMLIVLQSSYVDLSRFIYQTDTGTSTILGPVVSGILNGGILGYAMMTNCCSGGTDLIAVIIHKKHPEYNLSWVMFVLNAVVALSSYFVYDYKIEPVLLCIVYSYFSSTLSDKILKGNREAVKFEIITNSPKEISEEIITKLGHSATIIEAKGGYTHENRSVLICVVNKDQMVKLRNILEQYPGTFATISTVSSTVGYFKSRRKVPEAVGE